MIRRIYTVLGITIWFSALLPAQGSGLSGYELSDTARIHHAIESSHRLYEEFDNDSSLFFAAQALELSTFLLHSLNVKSDEQHVNRVKALKAHSYVAYAQAIKRLDIQAAEDSLMAGLNLVGETGSSEENAAIFSGLGNIYDLKGQNDIALEYFKKSLQLYQKSGDKQNSMVQLINIGLVFRMMGNYGESLEYLLESLKIGRQLNDTSSLVESLLAIGFVYAFVEKWTDALKYQQEALEIFRQTNDLLGIARIHNDMGVTYMTAGDLDSALIQHRAALAIRLESSDTYNTFASFLYIGDILTEQGNIREAIESYEKGLPYGDRAGVKITLVEANFMLGNNYLRLSEINPAWEKFKTALDLSMEIGDPTGKSMANMGLARISMIRKDYKTARARLMLAEKTAPESKMRYRKDLYKEIAETYSKLGDYKNAYRNSLIYSEVKDSVSAAENLGKITRLTNVLEFENEMALKKESNEKMMAIKQAEINRERFTRNIFLSGMILAVVLVVITFIRFVEKKKLNGKLNESLSSLKATQSQLVHAEKMASLGELTAGIAHEIQNPLNFVNNFSEVNQELIEELDVELERGNAREARAIVKDLKENEQKIYQHGKRADDIVKGMLQHSRTSTGGKEPTNINVLADEYLRLSYHGLRAKDKSFHAAFETDFDPALPHIEVVPQDIGRVLLNLINNAFYAVDQRAKQKKDEKYTPTVTLVTRSADGKIEVTVTDNGPGIPEQIRERIFQPFFTTKPTGQGTGLGLSLSYDIITKGHQGTIQLESKPEEFTSFTISLPIQTKKAL